MLNAICLLIILVLLTGCMPNREETVSELSSYRAFGDIMVNDEKDIIRFPAKVSVDEGFVQHLLHLRGYRWLQEKSAITTEIHLAALQKAFAYLDWELWDYLWQDIDSDKIDQVRLYVYYDGREHVAYELIETDEQLNISDYIFLGSPYFDRLAFAATGDVDCILCPVFPLEQQALGERFTRDSGLSGYTLDGSVMPEVGSKVEVIIKLSGGDHR